MGLPRASGKRRWSGEAGEEELGQSPAKIVCTSPPYALCAEDVIQDHPNHAYAPTSLVTSDMTDTFECEITHLPIEDSNDNEETIVSDCDDPLSDDHPHEDEDEDENFIDDEEDKDSGFIDGNSIDNSSDDEIDAKGEGFPSNISLQATSSSNSLNEDKTSAVVSVSDLQISLSKVLPNASPSFEHENVFSPTLNPPTSISSDVISINSATINGNFTSVTASSVSSSPVRPMDMKSGDVSITTVTAAQTGTTVTNAYQGSVPTPTYDLHSYQSAYSSDLYQPRPCTPSWSCTFYDGTQPTTTNKYMEISPNRSLTSQSIQCDENGKSYLELGSAAPYTNTYTTNECGNFTTSPSTYHGPSYSQSFSGSPPSYGPNNMYFNSRQNYSPNSHYGYQNGDAYNSNYESEGGCSYGYVNGTYLPHNTGRGHGIVNRIPPQRCSSPICDPTRTSPRPACYQQQRLSVLNLSMFKLNRFSRYPEPSLHRSVLICNTLRHIERELESEGVSMAAILAHSHAYGSHGQGVGSSPPGAGGTHCPETMPSMSSPVPLGEGPLPSLHSTLIGSPIQTATTPLPSPSIGNPASPPLYNSNGDSNLSYSAPHYSNSNDSPMQFEPRDNLHLRPFSPSPPLNDRHVLTITSDSLNDDDPQSMQLAPVQRASPAPCEERTEGINWCSVLSLSSQSDLDSMNNNECNEWNNESESESSLTPLTSSRESTIQTTGESSLQYSSQSEENTPAWKLPSLSADDVLKSFPEAPRRQEEDLDSIIKVLVGS